MSEEELPEGEEEEEEGAGGEGAGEIVAKPSSDIMGETDGRGRPDAQPRSLLQVGLARVAKARAKTKRPIKRSDKYKTYSIRMEPVALAVTITLDLSDTRTRPQLSCCRHAHTANIQTSH